MICRTVDDLQACTKIEKSQLQRTIFSVHILHQQIISVKFKLILEVKKEFNSNVNKFFFNDNVFNINWFQLIHSAPLSIKVFMGGDFQIL